MAGDRPARVLHINDAASTTTVLLRAAHRRSLPWSYLPLAATEPHWRGPWRYVRRALRGAGWEARLASLAARHDLLHVHVASVVKHTGWVPRPYVLHLHGTDVRSHQYDSARAQLIRRAISRAAAVLYSTPDLAHHLEWRPDATLLPVPIDTSQLPGWQPAPRPRIVFSSRWHEVKGLAVQLAVARAIRATAGDRVELVGVDWGPGAAAARAEGVRLVPRLSHAEFQRLLASAHVVVGQPTGMLAASELEALGIGVPVVAPLLGRWYAASGAALPPVMGGTALADAHGVPPQDPRVPGARAQRAADADALAGALADLALVGLEDPVATSAALDGGAWLAREHDAVVGVDRLLPLYHRLMREGRA